MLINTLKISNLRNLRQVELSAHPAINTFSGANGAGKTSILESLAVLSRGRSFRSNKIGRILGPDADSLRVVADITLDSATRDVPASRTRIGLERDARSWRARRDGSDLQQLSDLAQALAVVVMEPDSHELISGSPEIRRRYLDWGVFHVEPGYLDAWRRYARALKQRNAALRSGQEAVLASLEAVLVASGDAMTELRQKYVIELSRHITELSADLSPELGKVSIDFRQGWGSESLAEALKAHRRRDLDRGSTHYGPHRADLAVSIEGRAVRDTASRGEQKIIATALILAQARRQCETGRPPVLLLDDLASEFDRRHFEASLRVGGSLGVQMWITGVEEIDPGCPHFRFHVEHGEVRKMV